MNCKPLVCVALESKPWVCLELKNFAWSINDTRFFLLSRVESKDSLPVERAGC